MWFLWFLSNSTLCLVKIAIKLRSCLALHVSSYQKVAWQRVSVWVISWHHRHIICLWLALIHIWFTVFAVLICPFNSYTTHHQLAHLPVLMSKYGTWCTSKTKNKFLVNLAFISQAITMVYVSLYTRKSSDWVKKLKNLDYVIKCIRAVSLLSSTSC